MTVEITYALQDNRDITNSSSGKRNELESETLTVSRYLGRDSMRFPRKDSRKKDCSNVPTSFQISSRDDGGQRDQAELLFRSIFDDKNETRFDKQVYQQQYLVNRSPMICGSRKNSSISRSYDQDKLLRWIVGRESAAGFAGHALLTPSVQPPCSGATPRARQKWRSPRLRRTLLLT